jgi:hypothetical protein
VEADETEVSMASGNDTVKKARRSLQMVDDVELAIDLEPRRDRQLADFKRVANGAAERDHTSLERAEDRGPLRYLYCPLRRRSSAIP